jgi:hypothetical protein
MTRRLLGFGGAQTAKHFSPETRVDRKGLGNERKTAISRGGKLRVGVAVCRSVSVERMSGKRGWKKRFVRGIVLRISPRFPRSLNSISLSSLSSLPHFFPLWNLYPLPYTLLYTSPLPLPSKQSSLAPSVSPPALPPTKSSSFPISPRFSRGHVSELP